MKVKVLTKTGNEGTRTVELADSIWAVPMNHDIVAQVIHVYRNNQRKHSAKTKTRGEVRGGGKKPWAQKGTGRARHGSIRSPLWVGGGTTFGPSNYKKMLKVPKKMRNLSLKCLLSDKAKEDRVKVITSLDFEKPDTKLMKKLIENLGLSRSKVLIVFGSKIKEKGNLLKSATNLKKVGTMGVENLNSYRVINSNVLLFTEGAVKEMEKRLK